MRISIVGGIFDKDVGYRQSVPTTPETLLAAGLRRRGHEVTERGHWSGEPGDTDIIHVHHLGPGAIAAAAHPGSARFVYTNHASTHPSLMRALALKFVLSRADAVIALSEPEAAWQRRAAPVADRQQIIPNGVDEMVYRFLAPEWPHEPPCRLLYVGQLLPLKGLDHLLEAVGLIQPDHPVQLDLVYHVDTELPRLRRMSAHLGLTQVNFLGPRSPAKLLELYRHCDMLVLPSTSEALPSVISEAIIVGRPVVATDVGGVRGQVGRFGVLVPPCDPLALASAIVEVIEHYEDFVGMAEGESLRVRQRFSVAAMVQAHEELYERLLRSPTWRRSWRYVPGTRLANTALRLPVVRPRSASHL
jgi:glycosyltransferase involved in cell wall biosynthesis